MKQLLIDLGLAVALALPRLFHGGYETGRMLILGSVYAVISVLAYLRIVPTGAHRAGLAALAVTLLLLGWLESFPAGDHSAEIGLYILFGALALTRERHAVR